MKHTTMTKNGYPARGDRSKTYYGIGLWMDINYFAMTKDGIQGEDRTDPRVPIFNEQRIQNKLRQKFFEYGNRMNFKKAQIQAEWEKIINKCNRKTTDFFITNFPQFDSCVARLDDYVLGQDYLPFDEKTKAMVMSAEKHAYGVACNEIRKRQKHRNQWDVNAASKELILPGFSEYQNPGYIYLVKDEGKTIVKIGKTSEKDPRERLRKNCTYAPDTFMIFSAYVEDYEIVENELKEKYRHLLYKNKNNRREWFDLSDEQVDGLVAELESICIGCSHYETQKNTAS